MRNVVVTGCPRAALNRYRLRAVLSGLGVEYIDHGSFSGGGR